MEHGREIAGFGVFGTARAGEGYGGKRINLVRLAEAQRRLLLAVGGPLLLQAVLMILPVWAGPGAMRVMAAIWGVAFVVSVASVFVFSVQMAFAYGIGASQGVLLGIVLIVPCIGFIVLAMLNQGVVKTLERAGVRLGLFGVGKAEMHKLRVGVCRGCGYDLRGLGRAEKCPECGRGVARSCA